MKESSVTDKLLRLFRGTTKKAVKGEALKKFEIKETLDWYRSEWPYIFITPDLILALENYSKDPDEAHLIAIEIKYFPSSAKETKKPLRQAFREIGQPLRNLIFGFDLVVLWHLFSEDINDENIKRFVDLCNEVIRELKLPITYYATKIFDVKFRFYSPWASPDYHHDINYVTECLKQNLVAMEEKQRNPILRREKVMKMRKAIKIALNIP